MTFVTQRKRGHRAYIVLMVALLTLMPTYTALAEIQATPIGEPTPTEEVEEVVEEASGVNPDAPTSVDEAIAVPQGRGMVSPMSVNPIGTFQNCVQVPSNGDVDNGVLSPNRPNRVTCQLTVPSINGDDNAQQFGGIARPQLPSGFTVRIAVDGVVDGPVLSAGNGPGVVFFQFGVGAGGYRSASVQIRIEVGSLSPAAGSQFREVFNFCFAETVHGPCVGEPTGEVVVTAQRPTTSLLNVLNLDQDYTFECDPAELAVSAESNYQATSTCTLSNSGGILIPTLLPFVLDQITTTVTGNEGWAIYLLDSTGAPLAPNELPGTHVFDISSRPIFGSSERSYNFMIRFERSGCSGSSSANVAVYLGLRATLAGLGLGTVQFSPARLISATFESPDPSFGAKVIGGPVYVEVGYDLEDREGIEGNFTIQYTVSGCQPWYGYANISDFVRISPGATETLPELSSAKIDSEFLQNPPAGVTVVTDGNIHGNSPILLVTGVEPGRELETNIPVSLVYTIPGGTSVGTYTATITVSTRAAP